MYPTNEKTWHHLKSYCNIMPLTIKSMKLTMYLTTLTRFSYVSDLNKIIKQEQKKAVPSTFTVFTKQKIIIHYLEASPVSATVSACNCCTDTAF